MKDIIKLRYTTQLTFKLSHEVSRGIRASDVAVLDGHATFVGPILTDIKHLSLEIYLVAPCYVK